MSCSRCVKEPSGPYRGGLLLLALVVLSISWGCLPQQPQTYPEDAQVSSYPQQSPVQLQQLVAPIALYPDALVAQILAAATFPDQVVEADRWVQAHPDVKGEALGKLVDPEPWDPSIKALAAFPAVLASMDKNLAWTSSLGDAYYNQQDEVMDAVQIMRQRAHAAGHLQTTPQQTIAMQDSSIVIESASPDLVYVPAYDPWTIYGDPIDAWPGWYGYPGIWFGGPMLSFGGGFGIGFFGGYEWGWPHWGFNWHNRFATYNRGRYYSRSSTFYNRNRFYRGGGNRMGASPRPFNGNPRAARGQVPNRGQRGVRSGVFSGYQRGGQARGTASRGRGSLGGGAARGHHR